MNIPDGTRAYPVGHGLHEPAVHPYWHISANAPAFPQLSDQYRFKPEHALWSFALQHVPRTHQPPVPHDVPSVALLHDVVLSVDVHIWQGFVPFAAPSA